VVKKRGDYLKIEIASLGILQDYLSTKGKIIEIKGYSKLTIFELLKILKRKWGKDFYNSVIEKENLKDQFVILLNGLSIEMKNGLETEIKDGDRITISLFISGG